MNGEASRSKIQQICSRKNIRKVPSPTTSPIYGQATWASAVATRWQENKEICGLKSLPHVI
jgi:hypothetical protein